MSRNQFELWLNWDYFSFLELEVDCFFISEALSHIYLNICAAASLTRKERQTDGRHDEPRSRSYRGLAEWTSDATGPRGAATRTLIWSDELKVVEGRGRELGGICRGRR